MNAKTDKNILPAADAQGFIARTRDRHFTGEIKPSHPHFQTAKEFAYAEELRNLSYDDSLASDITMIEKDGKEELYHVVRLQSVESSLVTTVLVGQGDNNKVHVLFRGSKSIASFAIRDLEQSGAGEETYNAEKSLIMAQVNELLLQKSSSLVDGQRIELSVTGHSLGGADAQRGATSILTAIAQNIHDQQQPIRKTELSETFNNIRSDKQHIKERLELFTKDDLLAKEDRQGFAAVGKMTINTANAAGVSFKTAEKFAKQLKYIKTHSNLDVTMNALMVAGDAVQTTGEAAIAAGLDNNLLKVNLMKVERGHAGYMGAYTVQAHTSKHFTDKAAHDVIYDLFTNADEAGKELIRKKLNNKWGGVARTLASPLKKIMNGANRAIRGAYNWCYSWFRATKNEASIRLRELEAKIDRLMQEMEDTLAMVTDDDYDFIFPEEVMELAGIGGTCALESTSKVTILDVNNSHASNITDKPLTPAFARHSNDNDLAGFNVRYAAEEPEVMMAEPISSHRPILG